MTTALRRWTPGSALLAWALLAWVVPGSVRGQDFFPGGRDFVHYDPRGGPNGNGRLYVGDQSGDADCHYRLDLPGGKTLTQVHAGRDRSGAVGVWFVNGAGVKNGVFRDRFEQIGKDGKPCPSRSPGPSPTPAADASGAAPGTGAQSIRVSNDADGFALTCDGRFSVVVGANSTTPVSMVDLEAGVEVDTFAVDAIGSSAVACDDGQSVLVLFNGSQLATSVIRRLTVSPTGTLSATTGELAATGPNSAIAQVWAVPGSRIGLALTFDYGPNSAARLVTFSLADWRTLDSVRLGGFNELSAVVACAGDRVYARSNDRIEGFTLDPVSGALGDTAFLTITGVSPAYVPNTNRHTLAIAADGTRLIASEGADFPTPEVPAPQVTFFDALTGARLGTFAPPGLLMPTLVSTLACCAHAAPACPGDCGSDGRVTIGELIVLVNIALGEAQASACAHGLPGGAAVDVALIIQAVNNALAGCGGG